MLDDEYQYLILVLGMGLVTYIPRWFPLFFLSQQRLPRWFIEWLDLIPVAILSALIFSDLFVTGSPRQLDVFQPKSMVAIPTFLFALKTRSLGGTVIVGMALFWLATTFF
ncbi:branched-chain amino acid transport protein azld [hydrocarbon metagenome]|uniref:Branched-chain amino acid transport protein azld n=1 Tax=hydrocarbon metagenome TaxID=938273 RepID=A0A0W8F9F3_9ZZZZ